MLAHQLVGRSAEPPSSRSGTGGTAGGLATDVASRSLCTRERESSPLLEGARAFVHHVTSRHDTLRAPGLWAPEGAGLVPEVG